MPVSKHVRMGYTGKINLVEAAAGAGFAYYFRLNSVYDPDSSGVGSVATLYNTYAALFLNYKVNRVTFHAQFGIVSGLSGGFGQVVLAPLPYQAVLPSGAQFWKTIPGAQMKNIVSGTGGPSVASLVGSWDLARLSRLTKEQYAAEADFSGQIGSNPARQIYAFISGESIGSTTATTFTCSFQISYDVEWFNPVPAQ